MSDVPWPKQLLNANDHFVEGDQPDWQHNACVGPQLPERLGMNFYSGGFQRGARQLVSDVVSGAHHDLAVDLIVYPVVFLYRHHFELLLKLLIVSSKRYLKRPAEPPRGHGLLVLWNVARPLIEQCFPQDEWSQNNVAEALFKELEKVDPLGQAGRYPVDTAGVRSFQGIPLLNIRHFADVAERLSEYLNSVLFGIDVTVEQRNQWEAEMMSQYGE